MHDIGFDHLHPEPEERARLSETIWSADNIELTTVGVDIGSSTSHLMFARVHLQRLSEALSSRFVVVNREILWRSPILLTPYRSGNWIDADKLQSFITDCYEDAGLTSDDVHSGAVILTGEALKRRNARAIADLFAEESGKFVCASAGHNLEAIMAAHGSGAVAYSKRARKNVLNVDIGGGTTKLALIHGGEVLAHAALAVGGRLVAFGDEGELTRIEQPALKIAEAAGVSLEPGGRLDPAQRVKLTQAMANALISAVHLRPWHDLGKDLALTPPLPQGSNVDVVTFSGGVAEYIYRREQADFNDLGSELAARLVEALKDKRIPYPVYDPGQGIRATVIGASQYSVQVSGNTILITGKGCLPLRNVPVIHLPRPLDGDIVPETLADEIQRAMASFDLVEGDGAAALAFRWAGDPLHARLHALARGICIGFSKTIAAEAPLILLMDGDIARTLGEILRQELDVRGDIVTIDGVQLMQFDFVDIGELIEPTHVVPLVIKSLLFSTGPAVGTE
ncbi:MAG: ethanolamine ammonia-lyase reactivating factor EutA [Vicinamibacteria bacterium]